MTRSILIYSWDDWTSHQYFCNIGRDKVVLMTQVEKYFRKESFRYKRRSRYPMSLFSVACALTLLAGLANPVAAQDAAPTAPPKGQTPVVPQVPGAANPQQPNSPPPVRELTPAEINALQTLMTDRAAGTVLTPANSQALRSRIIDTQGALKPPNVVESIAPRPRKIEIDPQVLLSRPQTLQLALGVVTPVTFLDSSGRPWPVETVAFDPRMLAQDGAGCGSPPPSGPVVGAGERPTTITLMPCRINTYGNVSIKLEGYPLPLVLMTRSGNSGSVDLPVTIRVMGRSPNAPIVPAEAEAAYTPPPGSYGSSARRRGKEGKNPGRMLPDRVLDSFGAGVTPVNAQRVDVNDPSVSAWILDGRLYLRGTITVINPAQDAFAETVGGMKVWRFDHPVSRVLVVDQSGVERDLTVTF
jgi:intracellular multiplication protein IcmK